MSRLCFNVVIVVTRTKRCYDMGNFLITIRSLYVVACSNHMDGGFYKVSLHNATGVPYRPLHNTSGHYAVTLGFHWFLGLVHYQWLGQTSKRYMRVSIGPIGTAENWGYLVGSWREATLHIIVILVYIRENVTIIFK